MQPLRVYLSSTFEDLKAYREAVFLALEKGGLSVARMEGYTASDERPLDLCLRDVAQCDVFVGLYAWRYGYEPPAEHGNPDGRSITHLEYLKAESAGLRKLVFFAHPDTRADWPAAFRDDLSGQGEGGAKLQRLRQSLGTEKTGSFFRTRDELATLVLASIMRSGMSGRIYNVPPLPPDVVPRTSLVDGVVAGLVEGGGEGGPGRHTLIQGAGGFGKTTLALLACHRPELLRAYPDGLLWTSLGEAPELARVLGDLHVLATGGPAGVTGTGELAAALAKALHGRRCLVVLDDVWREDDLLPFMRLDGPRLLVTTRNRGLVQQGSTDPWPEVAVEEMSADEAAAMLGRGLEPSEADLAALRDLAGRLGCWPLLIDLAGARLREEHKRGRGTLAQCIQFAATLLERKGVLGFDRRDSQARNAAVARSVDVGLELAAQMLPHAALPQKAAELSIFPENEATAVQLLADLGGLDSFDVEEDVLRPLDQLSLLRWNREAATVRLHMMVHRALNARLQAAAGGPQAAHRRLLDAWGDPMHLPHAWAWAGFGWHCVQAGDAARLRALLLDPGWMRARLQAAVRRVDGRDVAHLGEVLRDHALLADDPVIAALRQALRLSAHALSLQPGLLPQQLHGRLEGSPHGELAALAAAAAELTRADALQPLRAALAPPGAVLAVQRDAHDAAEPLLLPGGRRLLAWHDRRLSLIETTEALDTTAHLDLDEEVGTARLLPDGRSLIVECARSVHLIRVAERLEPAWRVDLPGEVQTSLVLPDGKHLLCFCRADHGPLQGWRWPMATGGEPMLQGEWHLDDDTGLSVLPGGRRALIMSGDGLLAPPLLLDLEDGCRALRLSLTVDGHGYVPIIGPAGRRALLVPQREEPSDSDPLAWVLDLEHGGEAAPVLIDDEDFDPHADRRRVDVLAISDDDARALIATGEPSMYLWSQGEPALPVHGPHWHLCYASWARWLPHGGEAIAWLMAYPYDPARDGAGELWWVLPWGHATRLADVQGEPGELMLSPDGRRALLITEAQLVLLSLQDGADPQCAVHANPGVSSACWLPDSQRVLLWDGEDSALRLWDTTAGGDALLLAGQERGIDSVSLLDRGRRAVSRSPLGTLQLWDLDAATQGAPRARHASAVCGAVVLGEGRQALTWSLDGSCRLWDLATGDAGHEVPRLVQAPAEIERVQPLRDGQRVLVTASGSGDAWLLDVGTGEARILVPDARVSDLQWQDVQDPDHAVLWYGTDESDRRFALPMRRVGRSDRAMVMPGAGAADGALLELHADGVALNLQSNGDVALNVPCDDGTVLVWTLVARGDEDDDAWMDLQLQALSAARGDAAWRALGTWRARPGEWLRGALLVPASRQLLSWTGLGTVLLSSTDDDTAPAVLAGHEAGVNGMALLPDGRRALSWSDDGSLRLWDLAQRKTLAVLTGEGSMVRHAVIVAGGRMAAAAHGDTVCLWDLQAKRIVGRYVCDDVVQALAAAPDGACVVVGDDAGWVQVLRIDTARAAAAGS